MKIRKAIIPAAGLGTRFLPATKAQPKEMLTIVDKPTIQYIVEEASKSGIEDIVIITGHTKKSIEDHFDRSFELEYELERKGDTEMLDTVRSIANLANIYYIRQQTPKGLGHAIYCARTFVGDEPFAVMLGDDIVGKTDKPALKQLMDVYDKVGYSVLGVQEVESADVNKYGIVDPEAPFDGNVCKARGLVEKPAAINAPSNIAILGRYVLNSGIFPILEHLPAGRNGEIQLTDALQLLLKEEPIYCCKFEGRRYDVGDKLGYLSAAVEFALDHPEVSHRFAQYLATIALDKTLPVHDAIRSEIQRRKELQS